MIGRLTLAIAFALFALPAFGETYHREDLYLPMAAAGKRGLETMFLRPDVPSKFPLVVISHGAPRKASDKAGMAPTSYYPHAMEFARRGFAVAVVMRRGYGGSGGGDVKRTHSCSDPDYVTSGRNSAQDIKAAIKALAQRPDVDGTRILAVGQSAGGFATVALTADPPPGLVAAISFAGGRGSRSDFVICNEGNLAAAFGRFGKTSRVPMLWIYTANDRFFAPAVADKLYGAFSGAGGKAEYIHAPAFGKDGHQLFSGGIRLWTPIVDAFLAKQNLVLRTNPMDLPPLPDVATPPQLSYRGRETFNRYLRAGTHKAFAVSSDGHFGWRTGRRTIKEATDDALKFCRGGAKDCRIVFVDDAPAP